LGHILKVVNLRRLGFFFFLFFFHRN
jgi:hypothetical protein